MTAGARLAEVLAQDQGRMLATLIAWCRDFALAEDALQDALEAALSAWEGVEILNPRAWLLNAARRRAIDRLRRRKTQLDKLPELTTLASLEARADVAPDETEAIQDERLRLIFTCCHPELSQAARVALTLRTIGGLTTEQIARALLVKTPTMAQRLVRAQTKIREAAIPYAVPDPPEWPERLSSVLTTVYLIFHQGHEGETPLVAEGMRLGYLLADLMPREPEVLGLLSLMLSTTGRRAGLMNEDGEYVPLDRQDRELWDQELMTRGAALLGRALSRRRPGPFQIQAAISALHNEARTADETDWAQIAALYHELLRRTPSPVLEINRAIAVCHAHSPKLALRLLEELPESALLDFQPYHAARAYVLRACGQIDAARDAYRSSIARTTDPAQRRFLEGELTGCTHA